MPGNQYAVQVKNIKKSFFLPNHKSNSIKGTITQVFKKKEKGGKTFNALNDISFNVEKGDFFGILGRNGSGKSTLLKIISEIYQPTSGSVINEGKVVSFIELGVGFKSELSGRENVYLNGALLGFSRKEVESMYDEIVAFAELEQFMGQKLKNYSSGMKVRLAFSVAIRAKADILILDEVLAVGDAAFQKKCNEYFTTLKDDGKTVILVTHSMGAVKDYCNKAILIEDGVVLHRGDAVDVADRYLELFAKTRDDNKTEDIRFGEGGASIDTITTDVTQKTIRIKVKYRSESVDTKKAIIGIDFFNQNGRIVGGFESLSCTNGRLIELKAGQSGQLEYEIENIFGTGDYAVTASLKKENNVMIYDFWKRANEFSNVNKADHDGYFPVVIPAIQKLKT